MESRPLGKPPGLPPTHRPQHNPTDPLAEQPSHHAEPPVTSAVTPAAPPHLADPTYIALCKQYDAAVSKLVGWLTWRSLEPVALAREFKMHAHDLMLWLLRAGQHDECGYVKQIAGQLLDDVWLQAGKPKAHEFILLDSAPAELLKLMGPAAKAEGQAPLDTSTATGTKRRYDQLTLESADATHALTVSLDHNAKTFLTEIVRSIAQPIARGPLGYPKQVLALLTLFDRLPEQMVDMAKLKQFVVCATTAIMLLEHDPLLRFEFVAMYLEQCRGVLDCPDWKHLTKQGFSDLAMGPHIPERVVALFRLLHAQAHPRILGAFYGGELLGALRAPASGRKNATWIEFLKACCPDDVAWIDAAMARSAT